MKAIFSVDKSPKFRVLAQDNPAVFAAPICSQLDILKMKYQKQNVLLGQMGARCTYKDLASSNSTKNIITMIEREFPWWGELHGWWHTNPAYNSTWSAADSGQDFTRCMVELFKLWPNPPSIDSINPAAGPPNSPQLEEGEIEDNFCADDSELMHVDGNPTLSHVETPSYPIPSPSPLFSE
ncbi:hypothetical protein M404DRAFT_33760 [Pisolithus tinctorius Marx 270]|uniref:Uncharacterized protein n=1 Tax=Pisolithus tinctorius Marx 270 TaxID=870435 RepID=A0A0C3IG22_PISTI|nr:hypothetical protein M404DRAFT_33760 [Pisolithus tinctorius Marx 270]